MPAPTNLYKTSTPSGGPISAGGAGSTLWDGWIDNYGSKWSITAGNLLEAVSGASYNNSALIRPSAENKRDARIDWTFNQAVPINIQPGIVLRWASNGYGYFILLNFFNSEAKVFKTDSGGLAQIGSTQTFSTVYNNTHTYEVSFRAYDVSPTTLVLVITDTTASSTVVNYSTTDSSTDLNGATYQTGRYGLISVGTVDSGGTIKLYNTASASMTVAGPNSAAALPANHNGNIVLTLVGSATSWDGTTVFTPSGVSGWAKVSQSVTDTTHATVTLSCPTVASPPNGTTGTITITESVTGSATGTIAVNTPTLGRSPNTGSTGASASTAFTGTNTLWQGDNPQFTLSGGTGASVGSATASSNTASSATVTYGSAAGTLTITDPSTGAQTTITVTVPPTTVAVTNTDWVFSPNWYSDGAGAMGANNVKASSTFVRSAWTGSYCRLGFTGTACTIAYDTLPANSSLYVKTSVDNGQWSAETGLASAGGTIAVSGLSAGNHVIEVIIVRSDDNYDRWTTPSNALKITGATLDSSATTVAPGTSPVPPMRTKRMAVFGDSILQIGGNPVPAVVSPYAAATYDARLSFAQFLGAALDAEVGCFGCSNQGWGRAANPSGVPYNLAASVPNVPALYTSGTSARTSWDKHDASNSKLVGGLHVPTLDYIVNFHGTNDRGSDTAYATDGALTTAINQWFADVRTACPSAWIFLVVPFGGYRRAALTAATPPDSKVRIIDLDPTGLTLNPGLSGSPAFPNRRADGDNSGLHPNAATNAEIAARLAEAIQAILGGGKSQLVNGGLVH